FAGARTHFEQSGNLYRQEPNTLMQYAEACARTQQHAEAATAHFEAGLLLAKQAQYEAAARQFELAKQGGADSYDSGFNLALAYFNARNYASAVNVAGALAEARPTVELYSLLAKAHEASGKTKEAYDALRAAVRLNPRDETAYLDLVALCVGH